MKFRVKCVTTLLSLLIILISNSVWAQVNNFQSAYFQNQYITNPAMAGLDAGLNLNLAYQQQFNSVPGSPKMQNITADYGSSNNNVGIGLIVNNDRAGLISRTRAMGSYAYHLPVSETDKLSFGLSLGINDTYLDYNGIIGDQGDASADLFNRRTLYVDGDFGIAYTGRGLNVQAAVPNLKTVFFKKNQDQDLITNTTKFYTAISYKIPLNQTIEVNSTTLEPKVAYRGVQGFNNVFDAGLNLDMPDYHLNLSGMYHTNQSSTLALGLGLNNVGVLLAFTSNTGTENRYAKNTFELGLKIGFPNKL